MVRVSAAIGVQSFVWDFDKDTGDIGTYDSGMVLPPGAILQTRYAVIANALTGGGSMQIGVAGNLTLYHFFGALPVASVDIFAVNSLALPLPILINITGAPFTAGKIIFSFNYIMESMYCGAIPVTVARPIG